MRTEWQPNFWAVDGWCLCVHAQSKRKLLSSKPLKPTPSWCSPPPRALLPGCTWEQHSGPGTPGITEVHWALYVPLSSHSLSPSEHTQQGSLLPSHLNENAAAFPAPPAAAPRGVLRCSEVGFSSFRPLLYFTLPELFFWGEDLQPALDPALRTPGLLCSHRYWSSSVLNADHLGLKLRPGSSNGWPPRNKTNLTDPRLSSLKKQQHKNMFAKEVLLSMQEICRCSHLTISKVVYAVVHLDCFALPSRDSHSNIQKGLKWKLLDCCAKLTN